VFVGEDVGRFDAVPYEWRFLFAKRTEGFATSLLIETAISICLKYQLQLLLVAACTSIW
jgi:hypothetical protein